MLACLSAGSHLVLNRRCQLLLACKSRQHSATCLPAEGSCLELQPTSGAGGTSSLDCLRGPDIKAPPACPLSSMVGSRTWGTVGGHSLRQQCSACGCLCQHLAAWRLLSYLAGNLTSSMPAHPSVYDAAGKHQSCLANCCRRSEAKAAITEAGVMEAQEDPCPGADAGSLPGITAESVSPLWGFQSLQTEGSYRRWLAEQQVEVSERPQLLLRFADCVPRKRCLKPASDAG